MSVLELLKPNAAPHRLLCCYMSRLLNLDREFWVLLKGGAWTSSAAHLAVDACLRMCGNLHITYVTRYWRWTWKLSVLADNASEQTARDSAHTELELSSCEELTGQHGALRLALRAAFQ